MKDAEGPVLPVLVKEEHNAHHKHEEDGGRLAHLECPRNVRQIVEHDVGQRRVPVHVGDAVVDDDHHERGQHEHKEHVDVADEQFDEVWIQTTRYVAQRARLDSGGGRVFAVG